MGAIIDKHWGVLGVDLSRMEAILDKYGGCLLISIHLQIFIGNYQ